MPVLQFRSKISRLFSNLNGSERIDAIYDSIVSLKLSEVGALVDKFKASFNISSVASIPISNNAPVVNAAAASPPKESKTDYCVMLQKIDPSNKAKIIREIKVILPSLNLVEAKNFVESAPKIIKDKVKQDEANSIKNTLEALGAQVSLE
jgi:large subunit ribosomal protein L7/L12